MVRRNLLLAVLACSFAFALPACAEQAADPAHERFSESRFKQLQSDGAMVLIDVHADWCPTCAKQQKVLAAYQQARPATPLTILRVDFDTQKPAVTRFKAPRQSTLVLFKGPEQVWFTVAETRREAIFAALDDAAGK